jgi:hypothetical protein
MSFADFESELLSHETLLDNQQLQTINPESSSYALHSNKPSNNPTFSLANRKPKYPPKTNSNHFSPQPRTSPPNITRPPSIGLPFTQNQPHQFFNHNTTQSDF